ncbi:hypothetical protein CMO91_05985 [Candidatus Woesearchaeota archaeon]|nr:hypothetical protein [Candidatus Woesearchaeota archaeon]|tara:strand:+ start:801 stop:1145 length:345 start_codon:yes stop_codon:yes gene_type:complete
MWEKISVKDILSINQQFDRGSVVNKGSLEYALKQANQTKSWLKACALLVRAVLIDHVFEEGNKRTAAGIMVAFFEQQQLTYDPELVAKTITDILMKNITSITQIERRITHAIIR